MNKLKEIIGLLLEDMDDKVYQFYENSDYIKANIFDDFLYHNNSNFTKHIPWKVIPFLRLKKIWEDHAKYGVVRDEKGFNMIKDIIIDNITKIDIITNLAGHTAYGSSEEDYQDYIGNFIDNQLNCLIEKIDSAQLELPFDNPNKGYKEKELSDACNVTIHPFIQNLFNENYRNGMARETIKNILMEEMKDIFLSYYTEDEESEMGGYLSDYGLEPLLKLLYELLNSDDMDKELIIIDKILNVVHQRSDIARWFIEGGSSSLSMISGYAGDNATVNENKLRKLILEEIDRFKQNAIDNALDKYDEFNDFNNLADIDKLALLGGSNDPRLKKLDLSKIFKENGGTFGRFNITVIVKPINEQPINHTFSKEFAGKIGYLYPYTDYSDNNESYVTVRFNNFNKDSNYKGGGVYEERPIFLNNMYPIDYTDIKSEFKDYDRNVEKDRKNFTDRMNDLLDN